MNWIIKKADGKYVYTAGLSVVEKVFARRFSSAKQAGAYILSAFDKKDDLTVEELSDDEIKRIEQEIKYLKERS